VNQADHARLAADLLALIRLPGLVEHSRRAELLRAVAEHDNGWWEADAAPRFDARTRRPVDFRAVGDEERQEIWQRGVERHADREPYVAALVAGHALRLLAGRLQGGPDWVQFLADLSSLRDELAERSGLSDAELREDDAWLELGDELALCAATGDVAFVHREGWRVEASAGEEATELALAPFPLAGSTRFELSCRRLPPEFRVSDGELARSLASARWERRVVHLAPLDGANR
jgi:hypothetical protein